MRTLARFGTAVSALALAAALGGCAAQLSRGSAEAAKPGDPDFALATRALAALESNDPQAAIGLAERAVEQSPDDAMIRALLADSYFAAGRFASAEAAYRDSLSLAPMQPKAVLKLALVKIAQGRSAEALDVLGSGRHLLEPADYGLAMALAGRPEEAVAVLETAARAPRADSRLRQNLALAYGLAGNWEAARIVAAQDLPPGQVDARVQQWMAFATPERPSDQVAALVGVTPAAADPGQPVRLALHQDGTRVASAKPAPPPAPVAFAEAPQSAPVAPLAFASAPQSSPVEPISMADAPVAEPMALAAEAAPPAPQPEAAPIPAESEEAFVERLVASLESPAPRSEAAPAAAAALAAEREAAPVARRASMPRKSGRSDFVVQLGAFSNSDRVEDAWEMFADRHSELRGYTPTSARFDSKRGTVYRLSVKGFASFGEASELCAALKREGKACFVRRTAGDSPVQFASR